MSEFKPLRVLIADDEPLAAERLQLLLAPAVTEVVGPRINIRPISGLPLLHMERPEFRGVRRIVRSSCGKRKASACS